MSVDAVLAAYTGAFAAFDSDGVAACLARPCSFVSDHPTGPLLTVVASLAEVERAVTPIFDRHRTLGVTGGNAEVLRRTELSPRLACLELSVTLHDAAGARLYGFDGLYTFVERAGGWRIATIAHNQLPALSAALQAAGHG